MAFYDHEGSWPAAGRQSSWEQQQQQQQQPQQQSHQGQQPPSRSATGSSLSQPPDSNAFASQFEEIERATDNLMKSGKWFPGQVQAMAGMAGRQSHGAPVGRGFEYGDHPRAGAAPQRQSSGGDYDSARPGSAGLQGYYQGQRFPSGRPSEAEQMLQAKRRMAAQRERELRNYHQEQQYNRNVSGPKSDRSMSPNTMSEEDRRDLIARQHRALYGDTSSIYGADGASSRPASQDVRASHSARGASPLAFDPYGSQSAGEVAVQMPSRDHLNTATSPVSTSTTQQSFSLISGAQQSSRTSNSSPGESPPPGPSGKGSSTGVAPIGTRLVQPSTSTGGLNQRATTPLTPSSLSYGFNADGQSGGNGGGAKNANTSSATASNNNDERSTTSPSNGPTLGESNNKTGVSGLGGWSGASGVWGSGKNTLAVQPSVWG